MRRIANTVATSIGKGLVAGFVGTAVMTVSSSVEARLRRRASSSAPARATAKVLGIKEFEDPVAAARFNDLSHWGYGTSWGVVRGLLGATGLSPRTATAAHGAAIWGSAQVTLPALDVAPLPAHLAEPPAPEPLRIPSRETRDFVWRNANVLRTAEQLEELRGADHPMARWVATCALHRDECRGAHWRRDAVGQRDDLDGLHTVLDPVTETARFERWD